MRPSNIFLTPIVFNGVLDIDRCKTLWYTKHAVNKSCCLNMDNPEYLMDDADEMTGVFFIVYGI